MRRLIALIVSTSALALASLGSAAPALAAVCDSSTDTLGNGGFESPPVSPDTFTLFPAASVPPWQTTDSAGQIEIWGTGFLGVPAGAGNAFAELNANSAGTLYQDVVTTPGATMSWSLLHRARQGTDVMQVLIGDANVADVNGATGWNFVSPDLTDDTGAWGSHGADYVVPAGQTCTRFAFRAVSAGSGDDSVGNFLDAVGFTVSIPAVPTPTPAPAATVTVTVPPTDVDVRDRSSGSDGLLVGALLVTSAVAGAFVALVRTQRRRRRG
jgi:hypothetical protein